MINEILNFIKENYEIIILVGACLLDLILFLVGLLRKKTRPALDVVMTGAPIYIKYAEEFIGAGKGEEKKAFVMKYLCKTYKNLTGFDLVPGSVIYDDLDKFVEKILETPTKKGK